MSDPNTDFPEEQKLTCEQLMMLSHMGRIDRMVKAGMTVLQAAEAATKAETPDEYAARNKAALEALAERTLSPEYKERHARAHAISDPKMRRKYTPEAIIILAI